MSPAHPPLALESVASRPGSFRFAGTWSVAPWSDVSGSDSRRLGQHRPDRRPRCPRWAVVAVAVLRPASQSAAPNVPALRRGRAVDFERLHRCGPFGASSGLGGSPTRRSHVDVLSRDRWPATFASAGSWRRPATAWLVMSRID